MTVDRRRDPKADVGNFEMIYRQITPPTPAYIGLSLCIRGKQISSRFAEKSALGNSTGAIAGNGVGHQRCQQNLSTVKHPTARHRLKSSTSTIPPVEHRTMPTFNATDQIRQCLLWQSQTQSHSSTASTWRSTSMPNIINRNNQCCQQSLMTHPQQTWMTTSHTTTAVPLNVKRTKSCTSVKHWQQSRIVPMNTAAPITVNIKHSPNPKRARNYQRQPALKCARYLTPGAAAPGKQQVPLSCHLIDVTNNLDHIKSLSTGSRAKVVNRIGVDLKLKKISLPSNYNHHRYPRQQHQSLMHKCKEATTAFNYFPRNQTHLKVVTSAPNIHAIGRRIPAWNRCLQSSSRRLLTNYNQDSLVKRLL